MKKISFTIISIVFLIHNSCVPQKKFDCWANCKYVEGMIIGLAQADQIGLISFGEHENSYLALYEGNSFLGDSLYQKLYFKLHYKENIPIATNLTKDKPQLDSIISPDYKIESSIPYHSLYRHQGKSIHKAGHIRDVIEMASSTRNKIGYKILFDLDGKLDSLITYDKIMAKEANLYKKRQKQLFIFKVDSSTIQMDSCHRHDGQPMQCIN